MTVETAQESSVAVAMERDLDAQGPAEAFLAHGAAVHRYLSRRVGADAADDLLGEVFAVVLRQWARYDASVGALLPWLYGIAHRELSAHRRSAARRTALAVALAARTSDPGTDGWPEVDERLDAARLRDPLARALLSLPDDERDILLLVAWEHLTPTEAAHVLGIPAGTARSRLHRARRTIQPIMEALR